MKLSEHFDDSEAACKDGTPLPDEYRPNAEFLAHAVLEVIRAITGRPVDVTSWYRTKKHNAKHGVPGSSHLTAEGADINVRGLTPAETHHVILEAYRAGKLPGIGGLGIYPDWVHVDTRRAADGHLRRWSGEGMGGEVAG